MHKIVTTCDQISISAGPVQLLPPQIPITWPLETKTRPKNQKCTDQQQKPNPLNFRLSNSTATIKTIKQSRNLRPPMAELMIGGVPQGLQDLNFNPHHFRRGPMYFAYAELREWKLRTKNKRLPITPARPPPSSSTRRSAVVSQSVSMVFRKEKNGRPPPTPRHDFRLPPLATPKHEHARAMTNTIRGSASRVFSMQKSYNCLEGLKEYSVAVARSGMDDKGRSSAGRQRRRAESAMSLSWMG